MRRAKTIMMYMALGAAWGCTWLVVMMLVFSLSARTDVLRAIVDDFPAQALGSILVSMAFTVPAVMYKTGRPRMPFSFLIHFAVGMTVFFAAAQHLEWIPTRPGALAAVGFVLLGIAIFDAIWLLFFLWNRREAMRLNTRIRDLERAQRDAADEKGNK